MSAKKNETATATTATVPAVPAVANGAINASNLVEETRNLAVTAKFTVTELQSKRTDLVEALEKVDQEITELRNMLGGDTNNNSNRRGRASGGTDGRSTRQRNGKKLEDYCLEALRKVGAKGLSVRGIAEAIIAAGFTTTSTPEAFAKSCYVSGVNKLTKKGEAEHFKSQDGEGRYRLTAKGNARK